MSLKYIYRRTLKYSSFTLLILIFIVSCAKEAFQQEPAKSKYTLSVLANPSDGGVVIPKTGVYSSGQIVNIIASANNFYAFNNWTGNWSGSENLITITMDSNKSIIANFVKVDLDEDGVLNESDLCPSTPAGLSVDQSGCALSEKDSDGETDEDADSDGETDEDVDSDGETDEDVDSDAETDEDADNDGDEETDGDDIFYLDDNGVTIKAIENAQVGMKQLFNGIEYTIVSESQLRQMVENGEEVSNVVTSKISNLSKLFQLKDVVGNIEKWDVSNVTNMEFLFEGLGQQAEDIKQFNQDISNWDVSNVTNMWYMFAKTTFNQDISNWDVSNVTNMGAMFFVSSFNQDISNWDVSNVTNMNNLFGGSDFNQPIGNWNVSNVENMYGMFQNSPFNQPIGDWDVSKVVYMSHTFLRSKFNQDISNWNVSNVIGMRSMFEYAIFFKQDISSWDVSNVTNCNDFDKITNPRWLESNKPNFTNCNPD